MTPTHERNLRTLADWLVENADWLRAKPENTDADYVHRFDIMTYSYHLTEGVCDSVGCAIGWATKAIEPIRGNEHFRSFAERLFGTSDGIWGAGQFMFSCRWDKWDEQNDPVATAERIRWVLSHNGQAPKHTWRGVKAWWHST